MDRRFLLSTFLVVSLLMNIGAIAAFSFEPEWKEEFYNPNPNADGKDFILPLRGGGAMTFRPIEIVRHKLIDTKQFSLGNEKHVPKEYPVDATISGFFESDHETRFFYIGKYEVTKSQYDAVINGSKSENPSKLPKVNVSWFDAVQFCNKLTLWLLRNHKQLLPKDGDLISFIRLPAEEEWEFACRGGEVVPANFFYRDNFIPDDGDDTDYVQYWRSRDVEELQIIGKTKKPNPLGLYDMIGNAGEICFNLFRLNYHFGRSGGFVVRGGHLKLLDKEANMRSSIRYEVPFYDVQQAESYTSPFLGFRVVVAAPLYGSLQRNKTIKDQWNSTSLPPGGKLRISFAEAYDKINFVYSHIQDRELKKELSIIKNSYEGMAREINQIELKDAMAFFRIGAYSAGVIKRQSEKLRKIKVYLDNWKNDKRTKKAHIINMEGNARIISSIIINDLESYGDAVERLNGKYLQAPDFVTTACNHVIEKKRLQKKENQITAVKLVLKHAKEFSQRNADLWLRDIISSIQID